MTFRVEPLERHETHLGCLVETRRHANAHGLEIESVVLSVPDPERCAAAVDDEEDTTD